MVTKKEMTLFLSLIILGAALFGVGISLIDSSSVKTPIYFGLAAIIFGVTRLTIGEKIFSKCIVNYKSLKKN